MTKQWREICIGRGGGEGRLGSEFRFVRATVTERDGRFRCTVVEQWGTNQVYLEVHGETEVVGRGASADESIRSARGEALSADVDGKMLTVALNQAAIEAEDAQDREVTS